MVSKYYSVSLKLVIYACTVLSKYAEKIIYNSYAGFTYHKKIGFNQKSGKVIYNGVDSKYPTLYVKLALAVPLFPFITRVPFGDTNPELERDKFIL